MSWSGLRYLPRSCGYRVTFRRSRNFDPEGQRSCTVPSASLPALSDADFLYGSKARDGCDTYVFSAINVNSVAPYRDSVAPKVAIVLAAIRVSGTLIQASKYRRDIECGAVSLGSSNTNRSSFRSKRRCGSGGSGARRVRHRCPLAVLQELHYVSSTGEYAGSPLRRFRPSSAQHSIRREIAHGWTAPPSFVFPR
jgi:hypothetical protein